MDAVLKWIGIVGAAWMLLSILAGIAWALGAKRIFRKPPSPPSRETVITAARTGDVDAVVTELRRLERRNGRGY